MNRRTILKQVGAAGIATVGFAGSASATSKPSIELDRALDVSAVSGRVTLEELLDARDLERLSEDVNPAERTFVIDESAQRIELQYCCEYCCGPDPLVCDCNCCECTAAACE